MRESFRGFPDPPPRNTFEGNIEYEPELGSEGDAEREPPGPRVIAIFTCADKGLPMERRTSVMAVADKGLEGDRYYLGTGAYSQTKPSKVRDVSIISLEDIQAANTTNGTHFTPADTRRNIVVAGIELNGLVGKKIQLGPVTIEITGLCTPCDRPSKLSGKDDFRTVFENRGGIRGQILDNGEIRVGSKFEVVPDPQITA